jgi:DNA-binding NarL/FixJ family response regulator
MNNHVRPKRVLLVDDAPSVREALRWALEDEIDLPVVGEAGDGVLALELAQTLSPDLIILDIELPKLDGYGVARMLKAAIQPPLVIFLSVHTDLASRQQAFAAGGDGFVEKGLGWLALIAQIRTLIDRV